MTMRKMWVWMLLTLFTLVGEWHGRCYGCPEEERIGLLEIKSSFDITLRDWVDTSNESISNCCEWWGVECDHTTTRVIQLTLWGISDVSLGDLVLNASLFLPFKELRSFDLSYNNIVGCHENQGFEVLSSRLKKLESLHLSDNRFNDSILSSLAGFSSLKSLDLSNNELTGSSVGVEVLSSQLRKLERLDLSYNGFNDIILPHLCGFSSLKTVNLSGNMVSGSTTCLRKLEVLSLNEITIIGSTLLQSLGALPSLKILSLTDNNLSSTSISQVTFFNMTTLEELYLDRSSALPINFLQNIGQLPSLKILSVCDCDLIGNLPTQDNNLMGPISNWIGNLSALSVLLLRDNQFSGHFSLKENLDKASGTGSQTYEYMYLWHMSYETGLLGGKIDDAESQLEEINTQETIQFTTKRRSEGYKGTVLNFMTGFDLSNNRFSGEIPLEMGKLSELLALNLSHNNLTGSIPTTFSNLKQIESLDLSHNNFDGVIPPQLVVLNNLEVFSVAHNNLSGKAPEMKAQFGTFDESSYEGNPLLCGPPLQNKCSGEESPSQPMPNDEREDDGFIDMEVFYVSLGVSYVIMVLTIAAILYINPLWRGRWFHFIEECIGTCSCFLVVNLSKFSNFRRS